MNKEVGWTEKWQDNRKPFESCEHAAPIASGSSSQTDSEGGSTAASEVERECLVRVSRMAQRKLRHLKAVNQELQAERCRLQVRREVFTGVDRMLGHAYPRCNCSAVCGNKHQINEPEMKNNSDGSYLAWSAQVEVDRHVLLEQDDRLQLNEAMKSMDAMQQLLDAKDEHIGQIMDTLREIQACTAIQQSQLEEADAAKAELRGQLDSQHANLQEALCMLREVQNAPHIIRKELVEQREVCYDSWG
jgi:uncharacterized protein (UPF0147 family)